MCKCRSHGTFPPLRPSKFSFEYLLLPPRSAPTAAPPGLAPQVLQRPPRPPTHRGRHLPRRPGIGRALKRHPFSGLVDSAVGHRNPASGSSRIAVRLPKMAHLELSIPWRGSTKQPRRPTYLKFENSRTNDLHVSIAAGLHQSFPRLRPRSGIVHHLSGPDSACSHSNPSRKIKVGRRCNPQGDPARRLPYALRV
ncbi:unnamed protein product [Prunus brigantina]